MFQAELFKSEPVASIVNKRLLVLACSESKKDSAAPIPAINRYDGPMWKVLRSFIQRRPIAGMDIYVLSAEFGLIPAMQPIPWYDRVMTEERASELCESTLSQFSLIVKENCYSQVCFALSQLYLLALNGWENFVPQETIVTVTDGPMATKLGQLRSWLRGETWKASKYSAAHLLSAKIVKSEVMLKGITLRLSREEILQQARIALAAGIPGSDRYKDWCIKVDGQPVAPKWLVSQISGISVREFDASEARRVLLGLGIDIERAP